MVNRDTDEHVAEAILAYLTEAPHAMDTVEGVTEWWLMRQYVRSEVEVVTRVLERLVAEGMLEAVGDEHHRRYRLVPK